MMIDIDELKKVLAEATPGKFPGGEWQAGDDAIYLGVGLMLMDDFWEEDARAIVALHNSAPALIAELEAARAVSVAAEKFYFAVAHDLRWQNSDNEAKAWEATELLMSAMQEVKNAIAEWKKARGEG